VAALAIVGSTAGLGFATVGLSSPAFATCPASNQSNTSNTNVGPAYTSGGSPTSGSGYVGVGGTAPTGQGGYVEADGSAGAPPSGYVVASDGTSGVEVTSSGPSQC
jgi:hypothetical protein